MKSTAPFTSSTTQVPTSAGSRSTPTRSPPIASAARSRSHTPPAAARSARAARRARRSSAIRRGAATRRDRADDLSARDDDAQVVAARRDELLRDRAGRIEPRPVRSVARAPVRSRPRRRSGSRLRPSEPKRGLRTIGGSSSGSGSHGATCTVRGCGTPAAIQRGRGRELVVRRDERAASVEHGHARRFEPLERPEAGLDAVERRQDVEPSERDVAVAELARVAWAGVRTAPSRVFVGVTRWAMTAKVLICGNRAGRDPRKEGPSARPCPDCCSP